MGDCQSTPRFALSVFPKISEHAFGSYGILTNTQNNTCYTFQRYPAQPQSWHISLRLFYSAPGLMTYIYFHQDNPALGISDMQSNGKSHLVKEPAWVPGCYIADSQDLYVNLPVDPWSFRFLNTRRSDALDTNTGVVCHSQSGACSIDNTFSYQ